MPYIDWQLRMEGTEVSDLLGKTLFAIKQSGDKLLFVTNDNEWYLMYHEQDCCETVTLEDIIGNLDDLIGAPLLIAEGVSNDDAPPKMDEPYTYVPDSYTWTFYKFATNKGYVTLRWYGESNGYYSEKVDFVKLPEGYNWTGEAANGKTESD